MDLVGTTLGQFQVVEELGRGGMATVYKAFQPSLNRYVALKVLLPSLAQDAALVERFLREAKAAAALKHPHVITIYDIGSQGDTHYIVAEYLEGMTLAQLLEQEGQLGAERVLRILRQVADALDHAHREGYIHRDIKPSNIMIDPSRNDHATLMDFGLVRVMGGSQITRSGTIVGTPDYMSPEQAKGEELDQRTDIYSLGVTVYHMLTGSVPFGKPTPHAVMMAHVTEEPPSMTSLGQQTPLEVEAVVIKSMAKEPLDRYPWAGEMARDLENAITSTGLSTVHLMDELKTSVRETADRSSPMTSLPTDQEADSSSPRSRPESSTQRQASQLPAAPRLGTAPKATRPKWLWLLVGVLGAGLVGAIVLMCVVGLPLIGRLTQETPNATATQAASLAPAQPTATTAVRSQAPIYEEDFSAPGKEWEISSDETAEYRIEGGVYSIEVRAEHWIAWNAIGQEFGDCEIVFEVALVEGDSFNDAGLLFRFRDRDNFYELDIDGKGSFAVGKQIDGEWYQIIDWTSLPAIQTLGSVNRVRLTANGDQFSVVINDQTVGGFSDDTFASGSIAPVVTAYDDPPARATFDNIQVWGLEPR